MAIESDFGERIARIEERLTHVATKEDLVTMEARIIRWMVITMLLWGGLLVAAMKVLP